jgi:RNA polymerase sigma-70 factor (ECF subfamily)
MSSGRPGTDGDSSLEVLRRAQAGDRSAFEQLYLRHRDALLLSVRCRLSPALRARLSSEDVLQSVVADVLSDIVRFEPRGQGALAHWLHAAVLNKLRNKADWYGAQKRAGDVPLSDSLVGELAARSEGAPGYLEPESWEALEAALASLPTEMRETVLLRTVEGLSNAEAAAALGRSPEAASKLYQRALARLGARLSGAEEQ